ncbi:MAG: hypothetical protein RDU89_06905 [bacterium]|nr:hypothetical protein [bacterium]
MPRKVYISSDMSEDEGLVEVAEENPLAALLWPWLLTAFDDWGRASVSPKRLKAQVWPAVDVVTAELIQEAVTLFNRHGLLALYEVDGKPYAFIEPGKWFKYQTHIHQSKRQREGSRHPAPPCEVARESAAPREDARDLTPSTLPPFHLSPSGSRASCPDSPSPDAPPTDPDGQPPASTQFGEAAPAYEAAIYLRTKVLQHNPRTPVPRPDPRDRQMQRWAAEMDRLNRLGAPGGDKAPYSWDEIKRIVDWVFDTSDFWAPNIRSPAKLRAQITTLEGQMRRPANARPGRQRAANFNVHYEGKDEAWYEQFQESAEKFNQRRQEEEARRREAAQGDASRGPP